MADRQVGDYNQTLVINTAIDTTAYTTQALIVRKPDKTLVTWAPATVTATQITYVFGASDLLQTGTYLGEILLTRAAPPAQITSGQFSFTVGPRV